MSQITVFPMRIRTLPLASLLCAGALFLALLPACGGGQSSAEVDYSVSAKQNYEKGLKKLEDESWVAAAKYFSFIKARFPYSKYATLAELRLADAEFGAGHYLQAIDSYKLFIKFHPTHEMVVNGYAAFKIGESYVKQLPSDWFILPPSYEKDQSATQDAHRELTKFVKKYPNSSYASEAKELLDKVDRKLAEHEMYVARFYWERDRPMGTVLRLRRLLDRHADVGFDAEALYLLGRAYMKVEMPKRARKMFQRLLEEHPQQAKDARKRLRKLTG